MIFNGSKQGLLGRSAAPQGKGTDAMLIEVDLAARQAVRPVGAHGEALAEQVGVASLTGATDEDHLPGERCVQVQLEVLGHRPARWSGFGGRVRAGAVGGDVAIRAVLQFGDTGHTVALPDLGLPQAVEAFDGVLHAVLQRRHEHRNDPQRQTQATDAAHRVSELVRPLKHSVVVILGIRP